MIGKILTRLFALGGISLTCVACYGTPYDVYKPHFAASGRVVDEQGEPIKGIRVSMNEATTTNANGEFYVQGTVSLVEFTDVDGEDNGGTFQSRSIDLEEMGTVAELGDVELKRE